EMPPGALVKLVARRAGGVFERLMVAASTCSHLLAVREDRPLERGRKLDAVPLVFFRRGPQLVVEMCDAHDLQLTGPIERTDQVRERDGIRSAGQSDDYATGPGREVVPPNRRADLVEQHGSGGSGRTGGSGGPGGSRSAGAPYPPGSPD